MTDADLTLRAELAKHSIIGADNPRQGMGQVVPAPVVLCLSCGWMSAGDYEAHLADALLPLPVRVREDGRADAHRVVFHIGTGHVVCACGWVGKTDNITGLNGVQKYGQHRAALAEPNGEDAGD